ncbi:MAG TPA: DUF6421 family protein [Nakamurella sp.]
MFPRVTVWDGVPNSAHLTELITSRGYRTAGSPEACDVVVVGQGAALRDDVRALVSRGVGLVVVLDPARRPSTGPDADSVYALLASAGLDLDSDPAAGVAVGTQEETATATDLDLLARVDPAELSVTGTMRVRSPAAPLLRTATAGGHGAPVAAVAELGIGRVVVLGIGITGGHSSDELLFNAITYAAGHVRHRREPIRSGVTANPAWQQLKAAVTSIQALQAADGSVPDPADHHRAAALVATITAAISDISPHFEHDVDYLAALVKDFTRWADGGFTVPDFLDSLNAFHPETQRVDGREHLVVFPMYTQNGCPDRHVEAVLVQVIWPEFVADLEAAAYSNKLFVPIRFLDFTPGYDTNSAVLFPETIAMREVPKFTWGAIFADREAARFRTVVSAAADTTKLALPPDAARLLADQQLAEETFVMWDLIHDRTHMHGDLPFDPFMIKQRMPYFLYSLEELRCDLTAFRESVALEQQGVPHARLVQYAVILDRIFRFAITGSRVRNYDGLGGQLLFAWLHQHHVLHWTDNRLSIEWDRVTGAVLELGEQIEGLYWRSIDRPKVSHWLAAYRLVSGTVEPHPASVWAKGAAELPVSGPPKGLTDAVLPDEFPLSMFYEALSRKLSPVVTSTAGITG